MMVPLSIPIAALFGQEQSVNDLIWLYLIIVPFSYGFQGIIMLLVSSLNAMHKPVTAFYWNFMRLFVYTLPLAWLGSWLYGIEGLFAGITMGNIVGGVMGYLYALKLRKEALVS